MAEICDPSTGTLRREPCDASSECKTFELEERKLAPGMPREWVASRTIPWAACIPRTARPCELVFREGYNPAQFPAFTCEGDARVRCDIPNLPPYPTAFDDWQIVVGTTSGYLLATPCPQGETCRVATNEDRTGCFPKSAAPCDPEHFDVRCASGDAVRCDPAFSYERTAPCGVAGQTCQASCDGKMACSRAGAASCDPATIPATCASPTARSWCEPRTCRAESESCATVTVLTPGGPQNVPGRCAVVAGEPRCIRAVDVVCDAATFVDRCDATTAVRCDGGLERAFDCAGVGQTCDVAAGHAGCRAPLAPSCTTAKRCEGSVAVHCCPPTGLSPVSQTTMPCVPGREMRFDCASAGRSCTTIGTRIAECSL